MKESYGMKEAEGDYVEAFYVCDYFTNISESRSTVSRDPPRLNLSDSQTLISDKFSKI